MLIVVLLSLAILVSFSINIFLCWFVWRSLKQITEYDEELRDIIDAIKSFSSHLESIHQLEMFYGDENLRHLMRHANDIISTFSTYDLLLSDGEQND